jgi:hypothetical protein|tara:strand:+ start:209 stop:928 length:720 start_codon:yes stop_codon:yes gene_type:complete
MIEDSLGKRKHVMHYDAQIIPTKEEVEEILRIGYSLATSKQKAYAYKFHVLGPNKERSKKLYNIAEGRKIDVDFEAYGTTTESENYSENCGLFHIISAPYTFLITPRIAPPNLHFKYWYDSTGSKWQLADWEFINTRNRETTGIDVGMVAKAITGAALDRGWDVSYNSCFYNDKKKWPKSLPFISGERGFRPILMMTLGKGKKYFYERLQEDGTRRSDPKYNTAPLFEDIFEFIDGDTK